MDQYQPFFIIESGTAYTVSQRNGHADRRDPYLGDGLHMTFPCDVEGCAAPEQDIHKLAAKSGSAAAREDKKVRASDRRAKKRPGAVVAEAKR